MIRTNLRRRAKQKGTEVPGWVLLREQSALIVFGILFLLGVAAGAAVISWLEPAAAARLAEILSGFLDERRRQPMADTFFSALLPNLGLLILLTACGFCAISAPVIALVPLFRGMGFGLTASAMLAAFQLRAVASLCVLILPNLIWSALLLLLGCRDAMRMSVAFWQTMQPVQQRPPSIRAGGFCAKMLVYAVLLALGAAIEAYLFLIFAGTLLPV